MIALEAREINEVHNLGWVLRHWRKPDTSYSAPTEAGRSPFGNINIAATPFASPSLLLPASDPNFFTHIEPGVRPLVNACLQLNLFTYTSCEGHLYSASEGDERHVGLVMRNADEAGWLLSLWREVGEELSNILATGACDLAYMDHRLAYRGRIIRALDLYIVKRRNHPWSSYFDALDDVTSAAVAALLAAAARTQDVTRNA